MAMKWIKSASAALVAAALSILPAAAQGIGGPGPGPMPSPWTINGPTIYLQGQQCIVMPQIVTGGCKGNNTINAAAVYVGGSPVLTQATGASLTVGASVIIGGGNGRVLFDNGPGLLGEYTQAQLTAQINLATASLSGALPAWPNTTTTFFRGDGSYQTLNCAAVSGSGAFCAGTNAANLTGTLAAAQMPALTGDVTTTVGTVATTIAANAVTYAKFQQVAASSLVGNPTGSLATAQGITLGATLAFSGTALQTAALTGDVTASANSFATTVAKINGASLGTTTATSGNILIGSGAAWVTNAVTGAISLSSTGVTALTSSAFGNPPSPGVNLTGSNGTATTARRSDAVLVLDQSIAPTWTGQHQWTVARTIASATGANLDDVAVQAATTTVTGTTTITKFNKVTLYQPTFTDASVATITDASTLYIDNAPTCTGSLTCTNKWAVRVGTGNVSFPGTGNVLGTVTSGTWQGTVVSMTFGGSGANLTPSNGGIVWTNGTTMQVLAGTVTASQCLLSGSNSAPSWGSCAGGAAVASVSNSDGTLTISPTTGAVVASLALGHANTWTAAITDTVAPPQIILGVNTTTGGAIQFFGSTSGNLKLQPAAAAGASVTLTMPGVTDTIAVLGTSQTHSATQTFSGTLNVSGGFQSAGNTMTFPGSAGTLAALNIADQTITGGANVTTLGDTISAGNLTIDCGGRPIQSVTGSTSAWTITAPSNDGSCILILTNAGASAVAPTFTSFTVGSATGATISTVASAKFSIFIWRAGGTSGYSIFAHQ